MCKEDGSLSLETEVDENSDDVPGVSGCMTLKLVKVSTHTHTHTLSYCKGSFPKLSCFSLYFKVFH